MRKIIQAIELYPIYTLRELKENNKEPTIEIDEKLYHRWLAARKEFTEVQSELRKRIDPDDLINL